MGLQYPDEVLKASVCYILRRIWEVHTAAQSLPTPLRDGMARSVLLTLHHASTPQLTINCLGEGVLSARRNVVTMRLVKKKRERGKWEIFDNGPSDVREWECGLDKDGMK